MKSERREAIKMYAQQDRMTRLNRRTMMNGGCISMVVVVLATLIGIATTAAAIVVMVRAYG